MKSRGRSKLVTSSHVGWVSSHDQFDVSRNYRIWQVNHQTRPLTLAALAIGYWSPTHCSKKSFMVFPTLQHEVRLSMTHRSPDPSPGEIIVDKQTPHVFTKCDHLKHNFNDSIISYLNHIQIILNHHSPCMFSISSFPWFSTMMI